MIYVGCLDGLVHQWKVGEPVRELLHLDGSVIHIRFDHKHKVHAYAVSETLQLVD